MPYVKKLTFAPFFLLAYLVTIFQLNPLFASIDLIFSLSVNTLILFVILSASILLTSLAFALFVVLSEDWKVILPVGSMASVIPLVLLSPNLGLILTIGTIISLSLIYFTLENSLKTYLNFHPASILGPSIRYLSTLFIITISISYFLSVNAIIAEKGFDIPDSLIDTAINLTGSGTTAGEETAQPALPKISKEQIELLKQNPDLLKQSGLDPKILDSLDQTSQSPQTSTQLDKDLIKQTVKDQLQNLIQPYLSFVPAVLALLLFITLTSITSFITLFIYPILWLLFYILERSGFIKFVIETRSVKKMVT